MKMKMVDNEDCLEDIGDFCWHITEDGNRVLQLIIPRPGGQCFSEWPINHHNDCGATWRWDGNIENPSITPSLNAVHIWHGFVRDGFLIEA